jgi:hypothetical protein
MQGYRVGQDQSKVPLGIGCALVFPVAFFGMALIADHPGPPGRFGFAEYFGWGAICVAVAYCSASFVLRFRQRDSARFPYLGLALATPVALGVLLWVDIQPSTPSQVKRIVEYSLQVVGIMVIVGVMALIARIVIRLRR